MSTESENESEIIEAARDFLNFLRVERGLSHNTIQAYRRAIVRYLEYLDSNNIIKLEEIDKSCVESYLGTLTLKKEGGYSPSFIAQMLSAIRGFHRFLLSHGYTSTDPTGSFPSRKIPKRIPRVLTLAQTEAILSAPSSSDLGIRDTAILEILYATGMRISELVSLDLSSVDLEERTVFIKGKGSKYRIVPFGRKAEEALRRYLDESRPGLVRNPGQQALFLNTRGGRLTRQGCWKIIKKYADSCGLGEVVSPHVFRHTFATHLLEAGASLIVVQELLGHSSVSTTQIYTHVTAGHMRNVYLKTHPRA